MSKLSTVTVSFGRKIQTRPYENADASVSLTMVYDHEEEQRDIDEEITEAMARAVAHVEHTLGIQDTAPTKEVGTGKTPSKPAAKKEDVKKPAANPTKPTAAKPVTKPASPPAGTQESGVKLPSTSGRTATKPASPSKPKPPAPKKDKGGLQKGDLVKAISASMEALKERGETKGAEIIQEIVKNYLPEDCEPPFSYAKIEEIHWVAFIAEVEALRNDSK